MTRTKTALLLAVIACGLMAAVTASTANAAEAKFATAQVHGRYCNQVPRTVAANVVPVWAYMEVRRNGKLVRGIALSMRRYFQRKPWIWQPTVLSGCYTVLKYRRGRVPGRLCVTLYAPLHAPTGACQRVRTAPTGQKQVTFSVVLP